MAQKIAALDIGTVRIGLAISTEDQRLALPWRSIRVSSFEQSIGAIVEQLAGEGVQVIVLGLPLTLGGEMGPAVERSKRYAQALRQALPGVKIFAQDERLSSMQAEQSLRASACKRKDKREWVDAAAACIILQTWLDRRTQRAENSRKGAKKFE